MSDNTIHEARVAAQGHADDAERLTEVLDALNAHDKWDMAEKVRETVQEMPLAIETITTIRVTLGTGGPAHGVDFTERGATAWQQDWFIERQHVNLSDDTARTLADIWGIDLDEVFGR